MEEKIMNSGSTGAGDAAGMGTPGSVEESFRVLEEMVRRMEDPEATLEESFRLYQQGMEILKNVNGTLDAYEKKMQILSAGTYGEADGSDEEEA